MEERKTCSIIMLYYIRKKKRKKGYLHIKVMLTSLGVESAPENQLKKVDV